MIIKNVYVPMIFVHIQKNAGGSIFQYLNHDKEIKNVCGHKTLKEIKTLVYDNNPEYNTIKFEDYFKFTSFRNPWERILSNFKFRKQKSKKDYHWLKVRKLNMSFNEWIKATTENTGIEIIRNNSSYLSYISIDDKIAVDYVINFHKLNQDFEVIKKLCKFNGELGSTSHKCKRKDYKSYYNDASIELVRQIHEPDINLFKFDFNNTSQMDLSVIENKCMKVKEYIGV